jgi:hypothetical protein
MRSKCGQKKSTGSPKRKNDKAIASDNSMTLVSYIKLIKEGYDRDIHTKTLVHVAAGKKVCDIEEHFGVMTLELTS